MGGVAGEGGKRGRRISHTLGLQEEAKTRPRRAQEGFDLFVFGSWGAKGRKRGVQEGLETGKVERRRRRRHDHVAKGRQRSKKAAQVRPKRPPLTFKIIGFTIVKRIFFISLLNIMFTPAGR